MLNKLYQIIKHEERLLLDLNRLAEEQKNALIKFEMQKVEQLAVVQEQKLKDIRESEDQRIKLLMTWLGVSRVDAMSLKLSAIENKLTGESLTEIKKMRINMKKLVSNLHNLNNVNRVLAMRAKTSVQNILNLLVNSGRAVCNVKI